MDWGKFAAGLVELLNRILAFFKKSPTEKADEKKADIDANLDEFKKTGRPPK